MSLKSETGAWMVAIWNAAFPIGTEVTVTKDGGRQVPTRTRTEAWLTGSGDPVIAVFGITGGYLLTRVMPSGPSSAVWKAIREAEAEGRAPGAAEVTSG